MPNLVCREWIEHNFEQLKIWEQDAFTYFTKMITDKKELYPCIPAQQALKKNELRYSFLSSPTANQTPEDLGEILAKYTEISKETGEYASLAVFFETNEDAKTFNIDEYAEIFWSLLNKTTTFDKKDWPAHVSTDPDHSSFEFCFAGEPYFCFCSTPAHNIRKSRYFPYFLMTFQPRWVFANINGDTVVGKNLKKAIRNRLSKFDEIDAHPALGWYGKDSFLEWKQYFLGEDQTSPSKCPFSKGN